MMNEHSKRPREPRCARRSFLRLVATTTAAVSANSVLAAERNSAKSWPTGSTTSALEPFDHLMASFIDEQKVPGAALAVARKGKLVYARGFGLADVERQLPVAPTDLFRIASVSKPFTAVAIMQLVDKGRISLDDPVLKHIKLQPLLVSGTNPDPRWQKITVQHCLQHTGGWDRDKSYDPAFRPWDIAKAFGMRPPVAPTNIVRYMMGQPLDFEPGERYAYSNLGYLILARVLEAVTPQSYSAYVKNEVLDPLGIKSTRLGRALATNRADGEVKYYDRQSRVGPALYPPNIGKPVPIQYGAQNFEGFEAHGGWIASAVELVKFAAAFDDDRDCPILGPKAIEQMWSRPTGAAGYDENGSPKQAFYGCGWSVRPVGGKGKCNAWHTGKITGTESLLVRRYDGLCWAVLFNTDENPHQKLLSGLIDRPLHDAAAQVKQWPASDGFGEFLN
jgi:N-acyl-D-amino-acid deacylase